MPFKIISERPMMSGRDLNGAIGLRRLEGFCRGYFNPDISRATIEHRFPGLVRAALESQGMVRLDLAERASLGIGKGRVCLLGEHLDHDLGPTISTAMENGTICLGYSSQENKGRITFANTDPEFAPITLNISDLAVSRTTKPEWYYYPESCVIELAKQYPQVRTALESRGTKLVFDGQVPYGVPVSSGLSSSAAIENATLIALVNLFKDVLPVNEIKRHTLAEIAVAAENSFANCGRLDQHTSIAPEGRQGVVLDYWQMVRGNWDKAYKFFDLPEQVLLGVVSSDQPASTAQAGYRIRRLSGWAYAASLFNVLINRYPAFKKSAEEFLDSDKLRSEAPSLRDVYDYARSIGLDPLSMYDDVIMGFAGKQEEGKHILNMVSRYARNPSLAEKLLADCGLDRSEVEKMGPVFKPKYGQYILAEQARVQRAFEEMSRGNYLALGHLISGTHYGMSDTYEAGTRKNTSIIEILAQLGIHSRIVGAGFGGYNMFAIFGDTAEERMAKFEQAKELLEENGFNTCFMAPPGCGSAVFEVDEN